LQHRAATTWVSLPPPNVLRCQTQCCCAARAWASSAHSTLEKGAKASCDSGRAGCCNARGKALQDAVVEQQTVVDSSFVGHGSAAAALSAAACRASVSRARLPFCGRGGHLMRCRRAVCYGGVCCTQRERAYYGKSSCWSGQLATIMRQCCWPPPCQSILRHRVEPFSCVAVAGASTGALVQPCGCMPSIQPSGASVPLCCARGKTLSAAPRRARSVLGRPGATLPVA
jgi:hypothetical protein